MIKKFVRLNWVTVKPYFTFKSMIIFVGIALYLTVSSGSLTSAVSVGMMLGVLFVSYPFVVEEKNHLDTLYATLSLNRETVLLGRYLFTALLDGVAVLGAFALGSAGLSVMRLINGTPSEPTDTAPLIFALSGVLLLIQAVQIPLYFKLGYTKAKIVAVLPFALIMSAFLAMSQFGGGVFLDFAWEFFNSWLAVPILIAVFSLIVLVSYGLSVTFYKKREF
jgi:hypothetical protein